MQKDYTSMKRKENETDFVLKKPEEQPFDPFNFIGLFFGLMGVMLKVI